MQIYFEGRIMLNVGTTFREFDSVAGISKMTMSQLRIIFIININIYMCTNYSH